MVSRRFLVCALSLLALSQQLHAQLKVDLKLPRRLYMAYEPIMASIAITNFSGRDITLENNEGQNWLNFEVTNADGTLLPPRAGKSQFEPRRLAAGESCNFAVNLVTSYPVTEFGSYRIRASIYFAPMSKFFSSPLRNIEVSEGKVIWEQTLGVPEGQPDVGNQRQVSLLSFRNADENDLYVRIEDKDAGVIYETQKVGRLIAQGLPQIEVDPRNTLHLMQIVSPKTYLYSRIGLNGEQILHGTYYETKTRPKLARMANGDVGIAGGQAGGAPATAQETEATAAARPKISDRPAELPKE